MTAFQVAYTAKGYQCFRTVNGIYRLNVGPPFPDPKSAIRYAESLEAVEAADVSPLPTTRTATERQVERLGSSSEVPSPSGSPDRSIAVPPAVPDGDPTLGLV